MTMNKWCKIWKGIDLSVQNWHEEFNKFWPKHLKMSKIYTLLGFFWPNYRMFELRKYRGVMFDVTQDWYKIWRKTDWSFQKWYEKFGKFSPKHLKVSKLGLWWNPFVQSWKCRNLKFTGELFVATMNYYPKTEEGLTCQFKTDICILTNFPPSTRMSQKVALKFAACDQSI